MMTKQIMKIIIMYNKETIQSIGKQRYINYVKGVSHQTMSSIISVGSKNNFESLIMK